MIKRMKPRRRRIHRDLKPTRSPYLIKLFQTLQDKQGLIDYEAFNAIRAEFGRRPYSYSGYLNSISFILLRLNVYWEWYQTGKINGRLLALCLGHKKQFTYLKRRQEQAQLALGLSAA